MRRLTFGFGNAMASWRFHKMIVAQFSFAGLPAKTAASYLLVANDFPFILTIKYFTLIWRCFFLIQFFWYHLFSTIGGCCWHHGSINFTYVNDLLFNCFVIIFVLGKIISIIIFNIYLWIINIFLSLQSTFVSIRISRLEPRSFISYKFNFWLLLRILFINFTHVNTWLLAMLTCNHWTRV